MLTHGVAQYRTSASVHIQPIPHPHPVHPHFTTLAPTPNAIPLRKMSPIEPEDTVYFGDPWEAAQSFVIKQGFHMVSKDGMQRVIDEEWRKRCEF
jgi:hypothetical protein